MTSTLRLLRAAGLALLAALIVSGPLSASDDLTAEGQAAVQTWIDAVATGDPDKVAAVSAPEFQIVRGDGSAHDLPEYLVDLPVLEAIPEMKNVFVTGSEDQLVVRYTVDAIKDVDGITVDAYGPRLTVLRKQGDLWLVVAHSNFATVVQE